MKANPNQMDDIKEFVPAITLAAGVKETSNYLRLMLDYGGNPNIISYRLKEIIYTKTTPLNSAVSSSIENTKLLIEKGADLNLSPIEEFLPLTTALTSKNIEIVRYLILEKNADVNKVITITVNKDTLKISDLLRLNAFPLDSKEYQYKMDVVEFLKTQGIEYRKSPIPNYYYDNFPEDYLEKY